MRRFFALLLPALLLAACSDDITLSPPDVDAHGTRDDVLAPCTMTRAEALELMLSHGVGYGYNGLDGEICNVPDVRSQVLDPNGIFEAGCQVDLDKIEDSKLTFSSETAFSLNELLEKVYFGGSGSAELVVVFKGSVRGTLQLYNHKKVHSYFCTARACKNGFYSYIDGPSVSAAVADSALMASHPNMLTKNFRSAIARLGKNPTKMQMDSLIARYGTHVVTKCTLGGMIELEIRLEKDSIADIYRQKAIGEVALLSLYEHGDQSSEEKYDLKIINNGDSRLTVRGGDSRKLEHTLMNFNWGRDAVNSDDIGEWIESIGTDESKRQSLEMTSMEMMPIWEFIPDPDVAKRLQAHITGNANLLLDLYGYQNFVNTSFPACPNDACYENWTLYSESNTIMRTSQTSSSGRECYNVEAGGRYVATLCLEWIPEIDVNHPVWVAYPIYQRQVNIATGLCLHEGKAYRVGWQFGQIVVTPLDAGDLGDRIYMTAGYLYPKPTQGADYEQSRVVVGYEWPGGIKTDGTLATENAIYITYKEDDRFLLRHLDGEKQKGKLSALPNWTYNKNLNCMVRNESYVYYYDPLEVDYISRHPERFAMAPIVINENAVFTGTTSRPIHVAEEVDLTLKDATVNSIITAGGNKALLNRWARLWLDGTTVNGHIHCRPRTVIQLKEASTNTITAKTSGMAAIHAGGDLEIQGSGTLKAIGADGAAAIGGNANDTVSAYISILGGNITAFGGKRAPGIGAGSGESSKCGIITIEDGSITAYGGEGAAAIGSGAHGSSCYRIEIEGGKVEAYGGEGGAGIGCGTDNSSVKYIVLQSAIVIDGGDVHAQGGRGAAGIGSGAGNSSCSDITISGGSVTSIGGEGGAGVGSGIDGSNCYEIATRNGNIVAVGGTGGAGIGSGKAGICTDITCRENTVHASGGIGAPGIGSGAEGGSCKDIAIKSANATAIGGDRAAAIGSGYNNSSCRDIAITLYLLWSDPPVVTVTKGEDAEKAIGAGVNSTCGNIYIHDKAKITEQ